MSTSIQKRETPKTTMSPLMVLGSRFNIEPTKLMEVLRGTVIKPDKNGAATNEEVAAFCVVAAQYDLNPFTREIYAFRSQKGIVAIVPIDGWTKIVNRHTNANGVLDFDGCTFEEVEGENGLPVSCTCTMHVKGRKHPVTATERFSECKRDTGPWGQHPFRMLRHKAYMQAARYAFGLGGIHDEDEGRDIVNVTTTCLDNRQQVNEPKTSRTEQLAERFAPKATPKDAELPPTSEPVDEPGAAPVEAAPTTEPQAPGTPEPDTQEPPPENTSTLEGNLMEVENRPFKRRTGKDGMKYVLHVIGDANGKPTEVSTFSSTLADKAKEQIGHLVLLTVEKSAFGLSLVSIA